MDMMYGQSMLYANLKALFLQESKIFFFQGHFSYTRKKMKLQYVCVEECRKEEVIKIRKEKTQFLLTTSTSRNKISNLLCCMTAALL